MILKKEFIALTMILFFFHSEGQFFNHSLFPTFAKTFPFFV